MNRKDRRAKIRKMGLTWAQARAISMRVAREQKAETEFAGKAMKLTPAEARKVLGEWAARGGKLQ